MVFIILALILLSVNEVVACDICGSNTSNTIVDINAGQPKNYLQYGTFVKKVSFQDPTNDLSNSVMWGQLLTGAYSPHKRVEIKTVVPILYLSNTMKSAQATHNWGLGDVLIQGAYQVWERLPFENKSWSQFLTVSGGVELPTGSYAVSEDPLLSNISFGSKSFDFVLGANYRINKFKGNWSIGSIVKLNTINQERMLYGNTYSVYQQGTYEVLSKKHKLTAVGGFRYDYNERNILREIYQSKSGGHVVQSLLGLQGSKKQWTWNVNYLQPLWQQNGKDAFKHRATIFTSVQYQFSTKKSKS